MNKDLIKTDLNKIKDKTILQSMMNSFNEKYGLVVDENENITTNSLKVASLYGKEHKNVIAKIKDFIKEIPELGQLNFKPSSYINEQYKEQPMYVMDRQGFSMLVNKFTGKEALHFTYEYSLAFERMVKILERIKDVNTPCSNNQLQNIPTDLVINQITQLQNNDMQLAQSIQTTNTVLQSLNNCMKTFTTNIQTYVADSINSKDLQIDKISEMVGVRDRQTKMLTSYLKEKLSDILGYKVMASDEHYKRIKMNILHHFKVYLWEDICVQKFNEVHAYIDALERKDIIGF